MTQTNQTMTDTALAAAGYSEAAEPGAPATLNQYLVRSYHRTGERAQIVSAHDALQALYAVAGRKDFASLTRRWQRSPSLPDKDNCHAQLDRAGLTGWSVRRAEVDPAAAEHRNDVEVARRWTADGLPLEKLQAHGGYSTVTEADLA